MNQQQPFFAKIILLLCLLVIPSLSVAAQDKTNTNNDVLVCRNGQETIQVTIHALPGLLRTGATTFGECGCEGAYNDQGECFDCYTCNYGKYDDGCNVCTCDKEGRKATCTERACLIQAQPRCVVDCTTCGGPNGGSFFDGCNVCQCDHTGAVLCTDMACSNTEKEDPYCL